MPKLSYLGKGFGFPFRFSNTGGLKKTIGVSQVEEVEKINSSLRYILSMQIGERPMRRDFGSALRNMVFSPNDPSLDARIEFIVRTSIEKWERRVTVEIVKINRRFRKDGILMLDVTYRIINSNVIGNLVYPFYLPGRSDNSLRNSQVNFTPQR